MPCVSGGALAGGTSVCGLRPAGRPAPTGPAKTISFVCFGDGKGVRAEEGRAVRWSGEQMFSECAGQEQDTDPIPRGERLRQALWPQQSQVGSAAFGDQGLASFVHGRGN